MWHMPSEIPKRPQIFTKGISAFKNCTKKTFLCRIFKEAIYLKLNDLILELFRFKSDLPDPMFHFCLYSDDFDRDFARLKSEGIPVDYEPHPVMSAASGKTLKRAIFVRPDGELIEMRGENE